MAKNSDRKKKEGVTRQIVPFHVDAGHVVLDLGGVKTLLDTGSQLSFGDVPELELLGVKFKLHPDILGKVTVAEAVAGLRRDTPVSTAFHFDALLGLDILAGLTLELDWDAGLLTVSGTPGPRAMSRHGPSPRLVEVDVDGTRCPGFVDTGAWRSYLVPEVAVRLPNVGVFRDYNPFLGVLTPELRKARIAFEGRETELHVGNAPPMLAAAIRSLGAQALIGTDVLVPMRRTRLVIPASGEDQ